MNNEGRTQTIGAICTGCEQVIDGQIDECSKCGLPFCEECEQSREVHYYEECDGKML